MYAADHIQDCALASASDRERAYRAAFLAIASIRIQSSTFWPILPEAYREPDHWALALPIKRTALDGVRELIPTLMPKIRERDAESLHDALCEVSGLGPAKAGFIVQLWTGKLGCIDSVNLKRLGIDKPEFERMCRRKSGPAEYRDFLPEDSATMWQNWCETVATRDGFEAETLSHWHLSFIEHGDYNEN